MSVLLLLRIAKFSGKARFPRNYWGVDDSFSVRLFCPTNVCLFYTSSQASVRSHEAEDTRSVVRSVITILIQCSLGKDRWFPCFQRLPV